MTKRSAIPKESNGVSTAINQPQGTQQHLRNNHKNICKGLNRNNLRKLPLETENRGGNAVVKQ